jgi:phosphonate transport system permease protein
VSVVDESVATGALARLPPVPARTRLAWLRLATGVLLLIGLLVFAWININASLSELVSGIFGSHGIGDIIRRSVPPKGDVLKRSIQDSIVTFNTAVLGTFFATVVSLLLVPLGARNLAPNRVLYEIARTIFAITRSIPDLIFALLFVAAVGLGPFSGMLALAVHSVGIMGKLYSEAVEEMDTAPVDALRVAGAGRGQVFLHAVLPGISTTLVGLTLYRFDVNFRSSLVLGLVGAGGIGFDINQSISLFQYREVFTELAVVLVFVLAIERVSTTLRGRLGHQ